MKTITASLMDSFIPRGTSKAVRVVICDEDGDHFHLEDPVECDVLLRMTRHWTDREAILEKQGSIINASEGKVQFLFEPDDTSTLVCRAYQMDIFVIPEGSDPWIAFQGKLGITPTVEEEVAENG